MEEPVPYVPTNAAQGVELATDTSPAPSPVQRAVRSLHEATGRRAWATRPLSSAQALLTTPTAPSAREDGADPLVGLLAQLREAVTRYVCQLRADGARPEQMLVRVKALVREAMAAEGWHDPAAVQTLTAEAVRWSIDAFYDRTPGE